MGWWDSIWSSNTSPDDPLRKLDPKLREFLEKESPVKYNTNTAASAEPPSQAQKHPLPTRTAEASSSDRAEENGGAPAVPPQSQFPDGRYAHLWKTYRPLAEIEAETKSDHEKLMDVLEGYKERKNQIGRAALENCALEQLDWRNCMTNPSVTERMTLCRAQVKKFERCYMTQTRFLKALGYLSTLDRSPELEEQIQLHADKLYHRMLEQEAEVEKAKDEGRPIPKFAPLLPGRKPATAAADAAAAAGAAAPEPDLTPEQQATLREKLEQVPEADRPAEEAAIRGEWRAKAEIASQVKDLWKQQELERQARKQRGEPTMWDRVAGVFSSGNGSDNSNGNGNDNSTSTTTETKK